MQKMWGPSTLVQGRSSALSELLLDAGRSLVADVLLGSGHLVSFKRLIIALLIVVQRVEKGDQSFAYRCSCF